MRDEDSNICRCRARGRLKKEGVTIIVGDHAEFTPLSAGEGVLENILPRRNHLKRPQVANVDQVVIVCSPHDPPLSFHLLDRLLVQSEAQGLEAFICMNKLDLALNNELNSLRDVYGKAGYTVFGTSALKRQGIEQLAAIFKDRVSVLAGPSGVGKSSLLNCMQEGLTLRTGEISDRLGRGRHTTRHVELLPVDGGGLVADTPGFSQLELDGVLPRQLGHYFPEFESYAAHCRFNGCMHRSEPGCAVKAASEAEELSSVRYSSYLVILNEVFAQERSY